MRTSPCSSSWSHRVLLLVIVCALLAAPGSMAQAGPASTAELLTTLSTPPATSNMPSTLQTPAPTFLSGCTSNDQCPTGELCCLACGYAGCDTHACFLPVRGHCPFFS